LLDHVEHLTFDSTEAVGGAWGLARVCFEVFPRWEGHPFGPSAWISAHIDKDVCVWNEKRPLAFVRPASVVDVRRSSLAVVHRDGEFLAVRSQHC
jgi:hypothetical protein